MSQLFENIGFHLGVPIVLFVFFLIALVLLLSAPRSGRAGLLPAVASLALLSILFGIGRGALSVSSLFRAMSTVGGGEGAVAAGLAEVRALIFCGPAAAVLILLLGLALARPVPQPVAAGEPEELRRKSSLRRLLMVATGLAVAAVVLALEEIYLSNAIVGVVAVHAGAPVAAGSIGEVSAALAGHITRLLLFPLLLMPAALLIAVLSLVSDRRQAPPPSLVLWGRVLLGALLVLSLAYLVVCYGMHARFYEAAMTGHF